MAKDKGLKMQKKPVQKIIEYSGAGWYGEVYQERDGSWSWAAAIDAIDRTICGGANAYSYADSAARALHAFVKIEVELVFGADLLPFV